MKLFLLFTVAMAACIQALPSFPTLPIVWKGAQWKVGQKDVPGGNYNVIQSNNVEYRVIAPDPIDKSTPVMKVYYGNQTRSGGGSQFRSKVISATEAVLTYKVYFDPSFKPAKGGKLPGLYGGSHGHCAGGVLSNGIDCWTARLMWQKQQIEGVIYAYIPQKENLHFCQQKIASCNMGFGWSFHGGIFFQTGRWITITEYIKLNDVGKSNGIMGLEVDGVVKIYVDSVVFRKTAALKIDGLFFSTFYGGKCDQDITWCPPNPTHTCFKDFVISAQ